jgi:hypothetical protein
MNRNNDTFLPIGWGDSTHQNEAHTNYVKTFISQAQNDKIPTKNMFSLNIQADIVQQAA